MTAPAAAIPERRGVCPGISRPLPTGDGLLVRLIPAGTISLDAFAALCGAARRHGNGIIEITARGSVQVRGLTAASVPAFAADIAELAIATDDGVPVLCNALAGLGEDETFDASALAGALRLALAQQAIAARLDQKVSVIIDDGGPLNVARIPADIRLGAHGKAARCVAVGGDAANAVELGLIAPEQAVEAVLRLLTVLAQRGGRARDIVAAEGAAAFRAALRPLCLGRAVEPDHDPANDLHPASVRRSKEVIGSHRLRDGWLACGIGLAFGHAEASALEKLVASAASGGARGLRTAPDRALLAIGLSEQSAGTFIQAAAQLGFVTDAGDPRRRVIACAGAPLCASAHLTSRALAPQIADSAVPYLRDQTIIHVSGCAKGCAHAAPAPLTIAGVGEGCALIANGSARDTPFAIVAANDLPAAVASHFRARREALDA
jgi:precorrin-3B synthase